MPRNTDAPAIGGFTATCEVCKAVKDLGALYDARICKACDHRKRAGIQARIAAAATQAGLI